MLNEDEEKNTDLIKFKKSQSNVAISNQNTEVVFSHSLASNSDTVSSVDIKKIFGELLDEQVERVRKTSPFGNFKTWKICKIIGNDINTLINKLLISYSQKRRRFNTRAVCYPIDK